MKIILVLLLSCTLILSACSNIKTTQQLQRGRMSFETGDYREAYQRLLPLAADGEREAQYAVGYLYYYGYGVARDPETGLFWIKKSADQGYEPAQRALRELKGKS